MEHFICFLQFQHNLRSNARFSPKKIPGKKLFPDFEFEINSNQSFVKNVPTISRNIDWLWFHGKKHFLRRFTKWTRGTILQIIFMK